MYYWLNIFCGKRGQRHILSLWHHNKSVSGTDFTSRMDTTGKDVTIGGDVNGDGRIGLQGVIMFR
jgi:hypothetical protein